MPYIAIKGFPKDDETVLHTEIADIDLLDPVADHLVRLYWLRRRLFGGGAAKLRGILGKRDSSTGYAHIFAYIAINAANYALIAGWTTQRSLGCQRTGGSMGRTTTTCTRCGSVSNGTAGSIAKWARWTR